MGCPGNPGWVKTGENYELGYDLYRCCRRGQDGCQISLPVGENIKKRKCAGGFAELESGKSRPGN